MRDLAFHEERVDRGDDRAGPQAPVVPDHGLWEVREHEPHHPALSNRLVHQGVGEPSGERVQLAVSDHASVKAERRTIGIPLGGTGQQIGQGDVGVGQRAGNAGIILCEPHTFHQESFSPAPP